MIPPINMISFLLLPFYSCIKDKERLKRFNTGVCKTVYFPIGLVITSVFLASCLVMTPFAYFKVVFHKLVLGFRQKSCEMHCRALFDLLFGLPMLIVTALVDSVWFFKHLYQWNMIKVQEASKYPKISLRAFNRFYYTVNSRQGETCNAKKLVLELRNQFKTTDCIFGVLYANKSSFLEERIETNNSANRKLRVVGDLGNKKRA